MIITIAEGVQGGTVKSAGFRKGSGTSWQSNIDPSVEEELMLWRACNYFFKTGKCYPHLIPPREEKSRGGEEGKTKHYSKKALLCPGNVWVIA